MNYTPPSPLPSETRLARLTTWLALSVAWFAAHVVALFAPGAANRQLAQYARWARLLLCTRAWRRAKIANAPAPRRTYDTRSYKRPFTWRVVAGGALRRALAGRTTMDRARAIYAVLANSERWITRVVQRLARCFTKLRRTPYRALLAPTPCAISAAPAFADTS